LVPVVCPIDVWQTGRCASDISSQVRSGGFSPARRSGGPRLHPESSDIRQRTRGYMHACGKLREEAAIELGHIFKRGTLPVRLARRSWTRMGRKSRS